MVTALTEVNGMRNRQEEYHYHYQCKNQNTEQKSERYPGLHRNTGHAYSQDVLSFMLGREGKNVYIGNKKRKLQNGNKSKKRHLRRKLGFTQVQHSHSPSLGGLKQQGTFSVFKTVGRNEAGQ